MYYLHVKKIRFLEADYILKPQFRIGGMRILVPKHREIGMKSNKEKAIFRSPVK